MNTERTKNLTIEQTTTASIFNAFSGGLYPGNDRDSFVKNLNLLNERINNVTKELTYWDLYHITQAAYTAEELSIAQASLAPGESVVVNFDSTQNSEYSRGDVIVRLTNGTLTHIPALASGYYFPQKISSTEIPGNYFLQYAFSSVPPITGGSITKAVDEEVDQIQETIIFTGLESATPGNAYNIFADWEVNYNNDTVHGFVFNALMSDSTGYQPEGSSTYYLVPMVRFLVAGTGDHEDEYHEVVVHWTMSFLNNNPPQWLIIPQHDWSTDHFVLPNDLKIWAR